MRSFRQHGFRRLARGVAGPNYRAIGFAGIVLIAGSVAAHSNEVNGAPPNGVAHELASIKADLLALKARISDAELDGLQTADGVDHLREEMAALKARVVSAVNPSSVSIGVSSAAPERVQPPHRDVTVTGSLAQPPSLTPAEWAQMLKAEELRRQGDIAGARLVLEYLLRGGNLVAALKLGETYDPTRLAAWRVVGIRGDPQKARELYDQANAGGVWEGPEQLRDGASPSVPPVVSPPSQWRKPDARKVRANSGAMTVPRQIGRKRAAIPLQLQKQGRMRHRPPASDATSEVVQAAPSRYGLY